MTMSGCVTSGSGDGTEVTWKGRSIEERMDFRRKKSIEFEVYTRIENLDGISSLNIKKRSKLGGT
jgi:hypothetical protein